MLLRCVSDLIEYESRGVTVPSQRAGKNAVQPHVGINVQVGDQDVQQAFDKTGQTGERGGGVAARQAASAATLSRRGVVPAHWGCGGGDATDQGNGGDERDEGFVEQHCQEFGLKVLFV